MIIPPLVPEVLIPISGVIGILFALFLYTKVSAVRVGGGSAVIHSQNGREYLLEEEQRGEEEVVRRAAGGFYVPCQTHLLRQLDQQNDLTALHYSSASLSRRDPGGNS